MTQLFKSLLLVKDAMLMSLHSIDICQNINLKKRFLVCFQAIIFCLSDDQKSKYHLEIELLPHFITMFAKSGVDWYKESWVDDACFWTFTPLRKSQF